MKILVKASSGEYGNVDLALVDVDIAFILDLWAHWPAIPELTGLEFDSWSDWYEDHDAWALVIDRDGPVVNPSQDLGEGERMELERLIVRRDYCFWRAQSKYGDHVAETDCFHAQDLRALVPVMDQMKASIDDHGVGP